MPPPHAGGQVEIAGQYGLHRIIASGEAGLSDKNELAPLREEGVRKAEPRAFAPEEMVTCNECLRANAPIRDTCLYCSAGLPRSSSSQPAAGKLETLRVLGLETLAAADIEADAEPPPKRIRALEFTDDFLVASPTGAGEKESVRWDALVLLVTGRLIVNRLEIEQPRSRRNKKPAERRELSSDDAVLDLYTNGRDGGWRIGAGSFDFSCLGPAKSVLASENFVTLINTIRERAQNVVFDDSYAKARRALAEVWPVEQRTESHGWRRAGAGKFSMTTATVHDNEAQFTRYSHLRHHLRLREFSQDE
jgi:hypothetical protein